MPDDVVVTEVHRTAARDALCACTEAPHASFCMAANPRIVESIAWAFALVLSKPMAHITALEDELRERRDWAAALTRTLLEMEQENARLKHLVAATQRHLEGRG